MGEGGVGGEGVRGGMKDEGFKVGRGRGGDGEGGLSRGTLFRLAKEDGCGLRCCEEEEHKSERGLVWV